MQQDYNLQNIPSFQDEAIQKMAGDMWAKKERIIRNAISSLGYELTLDTAKNNLHRSIEANGDEHYHFNINGTSTWLCTFYAAPPLHIDYTKCPMSLIASLEIKFKSIT
jgi:hypothetical protein